MKISRLTYRITLGVFCIVFGPNAFPWNHSVQVGYGISHDPNYSRYNNSGVLLTSDLYAIRRTCSTFWSITGSLGQWYTTAPINKNLTTGAVSLALRYYPFDIVQKYPAYLLGSVGPAYMSNHQFGRNRQGSNLTFQINFGLGVEVKHFDVNFRMTHFSNAHLARPDDGFNVLYLLSVGYLF